MHADDPAAAMPSSCQILTDTVTSYWTIADMVMSSSYHILTDMAMPDATLESDPVGDCLRDDHIRDDCFRDDRVSPAMAASARIDDGGPRAMADRIGDDCIGDD